MPVFVVVAIALAVAATGGVVVAAVQLRRAATTLGASVTAAGARVGPLTDELADESAVTAVELEALQGGLDRLSTSRRAPRRPATAPPD